MKTKSGKWELQSQQHFLALLKTKDKTLIPSLLFHPPLTLALFFSPERLLKLSMLLSLQLATLPEHWQKDI